MVSVLEFDPYSSIEADVSGYSVYDEKRFLYQPIRIKAKHTNLEISLYRYFWHKTRIKPKRIIVMDDFVFFFVSNQEYFDAILYKNVLRDDLKKKIAIIRFENNLIKQIFALFPDVYIHDIKLLGIDGYNGKHVVLLKFIFQNDRLVAIGKNGEYIKKVDKLLEKNISCAIYNVPIKLWLPKIGYDFLKKRLSNGLRPNAKVNPPSDL